MPPQVQYQVQLEPTSQWALLRLNAHGPLKYTGMLQAIKDIFREEGLWGFWRGNVPAQLMVMPYTAIKFEVLHKVKTLVSGSSKAGILSNFQLDTAEFWKAKKKRKEKHERHKLRICAYRGRIVLLSKGFVGCAATVGSYPFDLLRTILASHGEPKVYPDMRVAFVGILETRGIQGLYAGLTPTLIEIVPYAGLHFGTYDTFKRWTMAWSHYRSYTRQTGDSLTGF